jgi:outer membrane receptor for ferrienterochelin and colicins
MLRTFTLLSVLMSAVGFQAAAQQVTSADSADIVTLSLEELMSLTVTSSTKTEVSLQRAPSVVRLFTREDIRQMGFQSLREVLDQIPGFEIQEYRAGHQLAWVRGVQARYNNKVLLLIDGVPMRDSYYGNFNIDEMIPIEIIDRVEIINGPGSVLYGTNSFSGVISITTKRDGKSVSVDGGSFSSYSVNAQYSGKGLFANANIYRTDGFSPDFNSDGKVRSHDQSATNQSFMASYNVKGLNLVGSFTDYKYPYRYRDSKGSYDFRRKPMYGAASYDFVLGTNSSLKLRAFYNQYGFEIDKTKYVSATSNDIKEISSELLNSSLYGADAEYYFTSRNNSIVGGVSVLSDHAQDIRWERSQEGGTAVNKEGGMIAGDRNTFTRTNVGIFLQDSYAFSGRVSLTTGVRYDILSNFDNQFNYRAGLTASFTDHWYGKVLFGTAYRIPSYREYLDVVSFNNDLKPETLRTLEAQFGYVTNRMDINVTLYNNHYTDFISEVLVETIEENGVVREIDDEVSFNFDNRNITGLELNGVLRPSSNLSIIAGVSYKLNATEKLGGYGTDKIVTAAQDVDFNKRDLIFLSRFTGNFTTSYAIGSIARVAVSAQYFSGRETPVDYQADVPESVQDASLADGFFKLNLYGSVSIIKGLSLNASVNNLFDAKIYSPPFGAQREYDAQWPGRVARVGVLYTF